MNIVEVFGAVEQDDFTVRSLLGGDTLRQIRESISKQDEIIALRTLVMDKPELADAVASRINELALIAPEPSFRHPYDIAIAAYVQVLSLVQSALLPQACWVAGALPASYFARRVAFDELTARRVQSGTRTSTVSVRTDNPIYSLSGTARREDIVFYSGTTLRPAARYVELKTAGAATPTSINPSQYHIISGVGIAATTAILTSNEVMARW